MKLLIIPKLKKRWFKTYTKESVSFKTYKVSMLRPNAHYSLFSSKERLYTGLTNDKKLRLSAALGIPLDEAFFKRYIAAVPRTGLELDTTIPEQELKFHFLFNHRDFNKHCEFFLH